MLKVISVSPEPALSHPVKPEAPPGPLRYGVAVGVTGLVLLVALALSRQYESPAPLLLFCLGVITTSWYGGLGPGLLATGLSLLLGSYFFLEPFRSLAVEQPTDWVRLVVFAITGIVVSWLFEALHRGRRRARAEALSAEVRRSELEAHMLERERGEEERGRLLEQLETERARLQALVEHMPAGVALAEAPSGQVVLANRQVEEIFGHRVIPTPNVESYKAWRAFHPDGRPLEIHEYPLARALQGETFRNEELLYERGDGTRSWLRASAAPIHDANGHPMGGVVLFSDVGGEKQVQEDLRASERRLELAMAELQEADRRKDDFLAVLAHELRNPLASLFNTLELLSLKETDPAMVAQAREVMERQVRQMARLVDDLLDVSRIIRGKIALRRAPVDLAEVVATAVDTSRPLIEARRHALTISLPERPVRLEADAARLAQVLANLLNNAAKYTEVGGRIDLTAERENGAVALRVRDNGSGISAEMLPQVFDLFAQAEGTLDRAQGGLGIGLTLARRLVEMHGGTVEAQSDGLGRGSEFVVYLPALAEPAGASPASKKDLSGPAAADGSRRVLVVDDNVDSAESLALLLQLYGHDVRLAHDGLTALEEARASAPDVMLLDIGLPKMDGYAVARSLREDPAFKNLKLIAMTGYAQDEDRRRTREAGFDHHLVKPVDLEALRELLIKGTVSS